MEAAAPGAEGEGMEEDNTGVTNPERAPVPAATLLAAKEETIAELRSRVASLERQVSVRQEEVRSRDALLDAKEQAVTLLREQLEADRRASDENRRIIADLASRIPRPDASQERQGLPQSSEVSSLRTEETRPSSRGTQEAAARRSSGDKPRSATYSESSRSRFASVGRLPKWQWVLGGSLSLIAAPAAVLLQIIMLLLAESLGLDDARYGLYFWLPLSLSALPGIFGYWVGLKLTNLSFWRHLAPMVGLLIAGTVLELWILVPALLPLLSWITVPLFGIGVGPVTSGPDPSLTNLLVALSLAALYSFAVVLGNARQRQNRTKLSDAGRSDSRWFPRQQAMVGLAGTVISAISALIGLIQVLITVIAGNGG
jgi:hypothetical protein